MRVGDSNRHFFDFLLERLERGLRDDVCALLHLFARDDERRNETQDITLTRGKREQTLSAALLDERRASGVKLHSDEQAGAANLFEVRMPGELFGEQSLELLAARLDVV